MGNPVLWTTQTAITAVRNTIQDPTGAASQRWTNAEIVDYLNRGLQQIVLDTETVSETSWLATMTADVREIALPSNFFKDKVVEVVKSATEVRRLTYLDRDDFEALFARDPTASGEPGYYWYWARKGSDPADPNYQTGSIYLYPVPDATVATTYGPSGDGQNTLRIWGYKIPDALSSSALTKTIELDIPYIEAMLMFAAALAKMDDGDVGLYDRMMANYERMVRKIMDVRAQKSRSRFSTIKARRGSLLTGDWSGGDLPWRRPWAE